MSTTTPNKKQEQVRVLIIEDNPGERSLLLEYLNRTSYAPYILLVEEAGDLVSGLRKMDTGQVDVVVLDLNLPDSNSLDTFHQVRRSHPEVAVVVLTGTEDESLGLEAIRHQAQDYLVKGSLVETILARSICYAMERQRLQNEVEQLRFKQRQRREVSQLEYYSHTRESDSGRIFSLAPSYGALVRQYVFAAREGNARPSEMVQQLASRLAAMGAEARDVVRLHLKVLKETGYWTTAAEERAFGMDARLALVELLGTLADLYKNEVRRLQGGE
ncbi:MAG: response regulator [Magnetococcales bacterium]|nr:response regulator [Magnetococcales bacterium]